MGTLQTGGPAVLHRIAPALGTVALLVVAGCAGAAPAPFPAARVQPAPIPYQAGTSAVAIAVARQEAASAADTSCDPTASLRPTGSPRVTPRSFMAKIRARGYLVAGVDPGTYHFGFFNPSRGQFEGFDIDMLHAIAKAIFGDPDKIEFKSITDAQRISAVRSGSVDIVAHTMIITCARLKRLDFSTVYFDTGQRVLVAKNSPAKSIADLGGQKVCATKGSISLANVAVAPSHPIPVAAPYWTDCLVLLQQGEVAAISTDAAILIGLTAQDPDTQAGGAAVHQRPIRPGHLQEAPRLCPVRQRSAGQDARQWPVGRRLCPLDRRTDPGPAESPLPLSRVAASSGCLGHGTGAPHPRSCVAR
jgi:polar amino acid transport system substrate-binding protein